MPPFADKIGVQRSSLSHLLSGRNKPSLDFILKILDVFPDVDLYWMINGKGSFQKIASRVDNKRLRRGDQTKCTLSIPESTASKNLFLKKKLILIKIKVVTKTKIFKTQ
jgi:transcriptional regulator with XRE-family HTH domain